MVVVTADVDVKGRPVLVAIEVSGQTNYNEVRIYANPVTTAYGQKDNWYKNQIIEALQDGRMLYSDKERSQKSPSGLWSQCPEGLWSSDFADNIARFQSYVKRFMPKEKQIKKAWRTIYSSWSENVEDPTDMFKRDGLNHRKAPIYIDGVPHIATVITALNGDPGQPRVYGEKFYDIDSIEKQTNQSATSGAPILRGVPHKIKIADGSSDRLTITQKQRIVNNQNTTYSVGDTAGKSAFALAMENAKELKSDRTGESVSNRSLLANALESVAQNDIEKRNLQEYQQKVEQLDKQEARLRELNAEIKELSFQKGPRDKERLGQLRDEKIKTQNRINTLDKSLLRLEATKPLQIDQYHFSDMIDFSILFLDDGMLLWADDISPNIADLKRGSYVVAGSIQYRKL